MLLALTLGALLVTAAASAAGSLSQTVARLQTESVDSYDTALARLTRDVRYAWWAEAPSPDRLQIADEQGRITEYAMVGDSLVLTRPSGDAGSIIGGLANVSFDVDRIQRLRSNRNLWNTTTIFQVSPPATSTGGFPVGPTGAIAFAVIASSDAGASNVAGVEDRFVGFEPTSLRLPIARVATGGRMQVEIRPAFGPGYAYPKPGAAAVTTFSVDTTALPAATVLVAATNPADPTTAVYGFPSRTTSLNIPAGGLTLQPGTAYVITLTPTTGAIVMGAYPSPTGPRLDVMQKPAGGAFTGFPGIVPMILSGNGSETTTFETPVVSQVRMSLVTEGGTERIASAGVLSQVLAEDPWLGVVPGEAPAP